MIDAHDEQLIRRLELDEGIHAKPYRDSVGKLTIGVGRNLDDNGLSRDEIRFLLVNDVQSALNDAARFFEWFDALNETRQRVVVNMIFNLGLSKFLGFKKMIAALEREDYIVVVDEMMDSKWARQVGPRAIRLSQMMRDGR